MLQPMNKSELLLRLQDIEWDDFEVKDASKGLPKNIWETVCAFANAAGGWIVLGVSQMGKKFEICGVDKPEKLELRIQRLKQDILFGFRNRKICGNIIMCFFRGLEPMRIILFGWETMGLLMKMKLNWMLCAKGL